MTHYLIIILLLIVAGFDPATAQTFRADSLEKQLQIVDDSRKVEILIELMGLVEQDRPSEALSYGRRAEEYLRTDPDPAMESLLLSQKGWANYYLNQPDLAMELAEQGEALAKSVSNDHGVAVANLLMGRLWREKGGYDQAIALLDNALFLSPEDDHVLFRSWILNELGTVYRRKGDSSRTLMYHTNALELIRETDDKAALATTLGFLGIINDIIGNYDEALRFHLQSLEIHEELKNRRGMAGSLTNIGTLHQQIDQYDEAMHFFELSLPIWKELGLANSLATTKNNMGAVHENLGEYEKARLYYQEAHGIWSEIGNTHNTAMALSNLGSAYSYLGDFEKALSLKKRALSSQMELGNHWGSSNTLNFIAQTYLRTMQPDSALVAAKQSLELANQTDSWPLIRFTHEILSEIYEEISDFEKSLMHHKLFKAANDSIFASDSKSVIAELQEQYRSQQQLQQIAILVQERELQQLRIAALSGGLLLLIIVVGLMYNRYNLKISAHQMREQLNETELEKARLHSDTIEAKTMLLQAENERKSDELKSARDLQLSMLPTVLPENAYASISAHMDTATEVGGDYYDADMPDDSTLIFCIGDATGHGTKAGILVTVMKCLFSLMPKEADLTECMHRYSESVKKMKLPGLYMAFALVRLKKNSLEIIGAGMPPAIIYRADTGKVESIELKGMPLGSVLGYPYSKKKVTLYPNDVLVLLSDGFPELRVNGGLMPGYDRPAKILAEIGTKSPEAIIEHFRKTAFDWIQDEKPNDDMTFLVLKMKNGRGL